MDFGEAIRLLKAGQCVARQGWNGKGMWIRVYHPETYVDTMTLPYIFMRTAQGEFVPWLASQTDVLSEDWVIAA